MTYAACNRIAGRRGYTLFELVVVVAIILVVSGLAAPLVFQNQYQDTKLVAGADLIRARWVDCRTQAIEENRPYRFCVIPNSKKFKIEPHTDSMENPEGTGGLVIYGELEEGVRFGTKDVPANADAEEGTGDYTTIAIFHPDGSAEEDVEITFGGAGGAMVTLRLKATTGTATTIRGAPPQ